MLVVRHLEGGRPTLVHPVGTLGNFDGVHIGHREILSRVVSDARSRGGRAIVITFHPHPISVLAADRAPAPICSLADRLRSFREAGMDLALVQRFTPEFSRMDAAAFVERYLVRGLGLEKIIIGHNVSFGQGRGGNAERLTELGQGLGFEVEVVGPVALGETRVSSSIIRQLLRAGDVAGARAMLGAPYGIGGRVVSGKKRGRTIGFPTANLRPDQEPLVPDGVYAARVEHPGGASLAVANLGTNPTFGDLTQRSLEAHLLDFSGDLYGKRLRVELVERIRGEAKFASIDALVMQIRRDAERARELLTDGGLRG